MNLLNLRNYLFLVATVTIATVASCGKDDPPAPPPPPPPADTLGLGWTKITISEAAGLADIFFIDNNIGWVCGGDYIGKSTNGGVSWTKQNLPGTGLNLYSLFFQDELRGWVVGTQGLYRTKDGGANWEKMTITNGTNLVDIQFLNPRLGYMVGNNGIFKSTDSGNTWTKLPPTITSPTSLCFIDSLKGWVITQQSVSSTSNAGNSLNVINAGTVTGQYCVQFVDASNGWVAGTAGVWRSTDGGVNFTRLSNTGDGGDIHFFNKDEGYIANGTRVFRSLNGGQTLTQVVNVATSNGLVEIHFTDMNHGWAASWNNFILRYAQ